MNRPNYGLDAPIVVRNLFFAGIVLPIFYYFGFNFIYSLYPFKMFLTLRWAAPLFAVVSYFASAGLMIFSSKIGKIKQRDYLLSLIEWQGNERVLDVGCGRGLLLIGSAKELRSGKAVGIDIWCKKDLSDNSAEAVRHNALLEGVTDRIEIVDGDASAMPFQDNSFDVIFSSLVVHNMSTEEKRFQAIDEMMRVLKPGGIMIVQDFRYVKDYAVYCKGQGATQVILSRLQFRIFPPVRFMMVTK